MTPALEGLDEFFDYKNRLMDDLLSDDEILRLLSDDLVAREKPEDLVYKQVFPFEYIPETIEHGFTFICCDVDIQRANSKTFLTPVLLIWVFSHRSKLRLQEGGVRTDRLCSQITKTINGSRFYGLGELELQSVKRFAPIQDYQGKAMTFYAKDFNRLSPTKMPAPSNRKAG